MIAMTDKSMFHLLIDMLNNLHYAREKPQDRFKQYNNQLKRGYDAGNKRLKLEK